MPGVGAPGRTKNLSLVPQLLTWAFALREHSTPPIVSEPTKPRKNLCAERASLSGPDCFAGTAASLPHPLEAG